MCNVEQRRELLGVRHPDYGQTVGCYAHLKRIIGDYHGAVEMYKECLELQLAAVGSRHVAFATTTNGLAQTHVLMGEYETGEKLLRDAIRIRRASLGESHTLCGVSIGDLAALKRRTGEFAESGALFEQALSIQKKALGMDHHVFARARSEYALLLSAATDDFSGAEAVFLEAAKIECSRLGDDHPVYASTICSLANLQIRQGRYAEAEEHLLRARTIQQKLVIRTFPQLIETEVALGTLYMHTDRMREAASVLDSAWARGGESRCATDPVRLGLLYARGSLCMRQAVSGRRGS